MKLLIKIIFITICFTNCKAQNKSTMETIYEQKINNITIKLLVNNVTYKIKDKDGKSIFQEKDGAIGYVDWETIIINQSGEKKILDSFHLKKESIQWRLGEQNGESPFPFYNIVESFIRNNQVYIIMHKGGTVVLDRYLFKEDNTFQKDSKIIARFLATPSLGPPAGYVIMKEFGNIVFFHLGIGTSMGQKSETLYTLNTLNNYLKRIIFDESMQKIKDEQKIFKTLDLEQNKEKVREEIKKALLVNKTVKEIDKVDYIGYIDDYVSYFSNKNNNRRSQGTIFFLYKTNKNQTKIIRYNNDKFEWQIGDYKEEEIKQP
jgi:hypothetical protein